MLARIAYELANEGGAFHDDITGKVGSLPDCAAGDVQGGIGGLPRQAHAAFNQLAFRQIVFDNCRHLAARFAQCANSFRTQVKHILARRGQEIDCCLGKVFQGIQDRQRI